ncbi:MAG: nucleotide exchange factor GrpE [Flavobacteriales bacterium]|nr:MAG: nucleotide exchange factor GrpE [Flavobacteriales bacterium]
MSEKDKELQNEENPIEQNLNGEPPKDEKEDAEEQQEDISEEEKLKLVVNELNDKYLRLFSEFENFRRRTAKERIELIGSASEDLIKQLLPVIDDFERANENNQNVEDIKAIKEGIQLVYQKFKNTLEQKGLKCMDSKGDKFDVDLHEAITKIPAPKKKLRGKVVDVIEKGYTLNEKVIRYAKVVIGE